MKWFGIKSNGKPLGFSSARGGEDFCVDVEFSLSEFEDNVWLVPDKSTAEKAMKNNPEWYSCGYSSPHNPYVKSKNLTIFEVDI